MASTASPLRGTQLHGLAARGGRGPCVVEGLVRGFDADDPETAEDRSDVGDRAVRDQRVLGVLSRGVNGTCRLGWCQAARVDETPRGLGVLFERRHGGHGPLHVSGSCRRLRRPGHRARGGRPACSRSWVVLSGFVSAVHVRASMKRASRWTGCVHHAARGWGAPQFRMRSRRVTAARYVGPGRWSASDGQKGLACSEALKGVRPTAFSLSLVCTSRTRRGAVDPAPAARARRWRAPTAHGLRDMRICNLRCSVRSTGLTPWSEDVQHPGHVRCSADFRRADNAHYVN